ncbi:hypothetical protein [Xanthomonas campestris]|uniref:hypothetical protein n=1 Tax=Xanthomonas campestris TaxID=339 RepID=UPI00096EB505|nr:hypothetical protein [Xanthomonas campestris]MCC5070462.1 hypothetical protein [Xanthomonas campestris pv. plantaginis]MCF8827818.1 hypothetical protein [Xanthomonas campestris pv. raphani]MCW2002352.1 hypothetical protein [Xanthomonas campestris]MEA9839339.1 hypothetical protein [Xanthomonas campestris pv. raphani]MEA9876554.1 hypothetical protein [Xanthomonas campestris pv. raphani]
MSPRAALALLAGFALADGATSALPGWTGPGSDLVRFALLLALIFVWLAADSRRQGFRRPMWLNIGMVLAWLIFIPIYLYRSRPAGRRLRATGGFLLAILASGLLFTLGSIIAESVFPSVS